MDTGITSILAKGLKNMDVNRFDGSGAGFRTRAARVMDEEPSRASDFGEKIFEKLGQVNAIQQESMELSRRMLTDPDSVDAHDVMLSLAEADMSLNITKNVIDRVIRAYRDITGTR
ncbi:MAG: flagellar hook-basal body complex protein FliE [Spirochaetales bacterium]|jgi:flagellar hook-basal body complex protein FliE|nr:flagellar hook-basal body complex protein FliE [Spirochaetales bacterium]